MEGRGVGMHIMEFAIIDGQGKALIDLEDISMFRENIGPDNRSNGTVLYFRHGNPAMVGVSESYETIEKVIKAMVHTAFTREMRLA